MTHSNDEAAKIAIDILARFERDLDAAVVAAGNAATATSNENIRCAAVIGVAQRLSGHLGCALAYLRVVAEKNPSVAPAINKQITEAREILEDCVSGLSKRLAERKGFGG